MEVKYAKAFDAMSQLGERLRTAREARGISLAEAASATRILPRYIQALENGDLQSLPGDVYARGFIRNYAQALDLPAEELIQQYRQERGEPTGKIKIVPAATPPRPRGCLLPSLSFFGSFFVILVLVVGAYFAAETFGLFTKAPITTANVTPTMPLRTATAFATTPAAPSSTARPAPTATPSTAGGGSIFPTALPIASATPTGGTTLPITAGLRVEVRVLPQASAQGSWIEARKDGKSDFNQALKPGESRTFADIQSELYLNIGDTSVTQLLVNGQVCAGFPSNNPGTPIRLTITEGVCPAQ